MAKNPDDVARVQAEREKGPQVCDIYEHHQGGYYRVAYRSVDEATLAQLVTYASIEHGHAWTRTLADFTADVEPGKPRFKLL